MPDGSEFHTVGAATLKPREANVVRTRGTDSGSGSVTCTGTGTGSSSMARLCCCRSAK